MKKETLYYFLTWTTLTTLSYLIVQYYFLYSWLDAPSGLFRQDRMLVLPLFPGFLLFLLSATIHTVALYGYRKQLFRLGAVPLRWPWLLLLVSGAVFLSSWGLDTLYYSLIDKSVSQAYANTVMQIAAGQGKAANAQVASAFASLPFFTQNIFLNFLGIIMGTSVSLLASKSLASQPKLSLQ